MGLRGPDRGAVQAMDANMDATFSEALKVRPPARPPGPQRRLLSA